MKRSLLLFSGLAVLATASAQTGSPYWSQMGRASTHRANCPGPTQTLNHILWSTPVDRHPQYTGGDVLYIHYGSPVITHNNVIVVPVKSGTTDGWLVEGRNGKTGSLIYTFNTDYSIPGYADLPVVPSFSPALSPDGRLYIPAAGGTILRRDNPESPTSTYTRLVFYGASLFGADRATYTAGVKINTPLTIDPSGNVFFGFTTFGTTMDRTQIGAAHLVSGLARITPSGVGTWTTLTKLTSDLTATHIEYNCAPALSADNTKVYVAVKKSAGGGYLIAADSTTLALRGRQRLFDPESGNEASMSDQSSGSPMVGTDGDVYFGVLENPFGEHNLRGFLLHYDSELVKRKPVGSFGWDNTPSMIPSSFVPSYGGLSPYLILTKYNNYGSAGGDGVNKIALLDPNVTQKDFKSAVPVMQEILTVPGVTPDPEIVDANHPNAVYEWCINTAAVDYYTRSALINSEDGHLYKWDLQTGVISPGVLLDGPRGQSYTPTVTGPTGIVYAINNARLFAVGS
jgi:hypothetical protein